MMQINLRYREKKTRLREQIYIYPLECREQTTVFEAHWHEEVEIIYSLVNGVLEIDGELYKLKPNELVFLSGKQLHHLTATSAGQVYAVLFNHELLDFKLNDSCQIEIMEKLKKGDLIFPHLLSEHDTPHDELACLVKKIIKLHQGESAVNKLKIKVALYSMILIFLEKGLLVSPSNQNKKNIAQIEYTKLAILFMEENFESNISVADIAAHVNLSSYYFIKMFREITGTTPMLYLRNLRLEYSEECLKKGKTITETAYSCGFNSLSYYIRIFKEKNGISPREFKKRAEY